MPRFPTREFVAFDLETTGLVAEIDRVVEIGAVRFDVQGRELGRFESLVNPGRAMSPAAEAVHGIGDADLADAPTARAVLPRFLQFLDGSPPTTLLAHNGTFDARFLGRELGRLGLAPPAFNVVDTLAFARRRLPGLANHRLDTVARALGLDPDNRHRALADSRRVQGIWLALGGPDAPGEELVAYRIEDAPWASVAPVGWDRVTEAIARGWTVRMEYSGGSRGGALRDITPKAFVQRGGVAYLLAFCHLDSSEKSFRLDRVLRYEVVGSRKISS